MSVYMFQMSSSFCVGVNKVRIRVNCNYAKGQLGYVLMGQEGSVRICSTSQWTVGICSYASRRVSWGG